MVLYLCVLIVFSLRRESLKLILTTDPFPRWFCHSCGPGINPNVIIYFRLLYNQGGRFKIINTIGHVLLFMNGFMSSVLIAILIFLGSMTNSGFRESIFQHCVALVGCLIISVYCLCFSLCHHNNSDSLFANQRFKRGMIGKYQNTFVGPPFLVLQFSSIPPSFL
jgi:hypothetical protein